VEVEVEVEVEVVAVMIVYGMEKVTEEESCMG